MRDKHDRWARALSSGSDWEVTLVEAVEDLAYRRQSVYELPPARSAADRKRESVEGSHPEYASNARVRIDAAEHVYHLALLAVGKEHEVDLHLAGFPGDWGKVGKRLAARPVVEELHKALFDRDAAVRLTMVEILALLALPESVPYLERLAQDEDEGQMIRDSVPKALECCRTQSGRDLRGRV